MVRSSRFNEGTQQPHLNKPKGSLEVSFRSEQLKQIWRWLGLSRGGAGVVGCARKGMTAGHTGQVTCRAVGEQGYGGCSAGLALAICD